MRTKHKRLLLVLGTFVFLDVVLRIFVWLGLIPYQQYPTIGGKPTFLDDIHPVVGVWHYPNAELHHITSDFDVTYQSNSYGACDRERTQQSSASRRVVVLGDSYVEGYGVDMNDRFTEQLETLTGIEHLNFGTSGCFGSIQEWLLYEDLASTFDHTDVFVFMLPFNDYGDNDPRNFPAKRYRPYLRKTDKEFEVYYPTAFEERQVVFRNWGQIFKNTIDNHWYLANLLRWTTRQIKQRGEAKRGRVTTTKPYDKFNDLDLERLLYTYRQIVQLAGKRQVTFFTIPAHDDFLWAQEHGYDFKLVHHLQTLANEHDNVTYVDLLPLFLKHAQENNLKYEDYTHAHDGHWSAFGHQVVANLVSQAVYQTKK